MRVSYRDFYRFASRVRAPGSLMPDIYGDAFQRLLSQITWVGSPALPATNTATGIRDSVIVGGSGRGVNEVDSLTISGIPMLGCLASDADAPTDLGVGYGVDLVSCTPTWGASGTIVQAVIPYGWSDWANHPVSGTSRILEAAGFTTQIIGTGGDVTQYSAKSGESTNIAKSPTDAQLDVVAYDWVAGTSGARYNQETRATFANTVTPTGTLYIGNSSLTTRPFHGALVTGIVPWVLSDAEYEILRVGLQNLFGGQVLQ